VRAVLFDLDDTLYPERSFVRSGFAAAAAFLEPIVGTAREVLMDHLERLHERDGRGRLFDTLLDEFEIVDPDRILGLSCVEVYRSHRPRLEPFPGVVDTLRSLRAGGLRLGLVSDGMASVQRSKLAALPEIAELLDVTVLTDELGREHWKPSPVGYLVACALLRVEPTTAAYVGNDPRKDFAGARVAGLHTIRVGRLPDEGGATIPKGASAEDADERVDPFSALVGAIGLGDTSRRS